VAKGEKIFVNYRREDSAGFAGRLTDALADYFGPERVFRDVTNIEYGEDFVKAIDTKLRESGALVVVIRDQWLTLEDDQGRRRLDDPDDLVVAEIAIALELGLPVVPVLIGEARMPTPDQLPERIRALARQNAITVTDERWQHDVTRLAKVLAIDVPGSVAQRKLNRIKWATVAMLSVGAIVPAGRLAYSVAGLLTEHNLLVDPEFARSTLTVHGFPPIFAGVAYVAILASAALGLLAMPYVAPWKRRFVGSAVVIAIVSTFASFLYYTLHNVESPTESLLVAYVVGATAIGAIFASLVLSGYESE